MNITRHRIRKQGGFRFLYSNSDGSDKIHESWAQAYNYVVIDGTRYTLKPDGTWSTKKESSPRP